MNLSTQARTDIASAILFTVTSLSLGYLLDSDAGSWWRSSAIWVWFEFSGLLFFMRPLFCEPGNRSACTNLICGLARSLGVFTLAMIPALATHAVPEFRQWLLVPAAVGSGTFTVGYLLATISRRMGD